MKIIFYTKENGEVPVLDFLQNLNPKLRQKTARQINILGELGFEMKEPDSKKISIKYKEEEKSIWELRTKFGSNITRVFYFFWDGDSIVLTNGFVKKSLKTPKAEIEKARRYQADYRARKAKEKN